MWQDAYVGLDLGISLTTGQLALIISQQVMLLLTSFPWGQALLRDDYSGLFQNVFFSLYWKQVGMVFWYLLWEPGWALGGKTHKSMGAPSGWVSLEFLILRLVCTVPLAIRQLSSSFPTLALVPKVISHGFIKPWLPVCAYLSLQSWGQQFALFLHLSYRSKKACWFFSSFSFLPVRAEWQLPSSLHMELETLSWLL